AFSFPESTNKAGPPCYVHGQLASCQTTLVTASAHERVRTKNFIKFKGIGGSEPKLKASDGPFRGYIYMLEALNKLPSRGRYFCFLSERLPGNLFFYYPSSLRSPPTC